MALGELPFDARAKRCGLRTTKAGSSGASAFVQVHTACHVQSARVPASRGRFDVVDAFRSDAHDAGFVIIYVY